MDDSLTELRQLAMRHAPAFAVRSTTALPSVGFWASHAPTPPLPFIYEPMVYFALQGSKRIITGERMLESVAGDFVVGSLDLPVMGQVILASREAPYVAVAVKLEPAAIAALLLELPGGSETASVPDDGEALMTSKATAQMCDALVVRVWRERTLLGGCGRIFSGGMRQLRLLLLSLVSTVFRRSRSGPRLPSWGFRFECVVELMRRNWDEMRTWDHRRVRRELLNTPTPKTVSRKVRTTEALLGGRRCVSIEPVARPSDVVILYLHGGSYLFGAPETHLDIGSRFALAAGARVILPDYRLAPEHPYPAALDDALQVLRALAESGVDRAHIALAGESAGGNLALAMVLALLDAGEPPPRAVALLSPWLDLSASSPSTCAAPDDYGDRQMLLGHARMFAGDVPLSDPRVSLVHRRLEGLPPLLVQVGGAERLLDEAITLARRAREASVDATLEVLPEMPHAPQLIAEWCTVGQAAIERAAHFLTTPRSVLMKGGA